MRDEEIEQQNQYYLSVEFDASSISVSYASSLLRVIQAALRELALDNADTRSNFDRQPSPILVLSIPRDPGLLKLHFNFVNPVDSTHLGNLSFQVFNLFLDSLGGFVMSLPQPGLWGGAARRSAQTSSRSAIIDRMDQVYVELRRSPKITLRFQDRSIEIEGDRMEMS